MTTPNGEGVNTSNEAWNTLAWMVSGPDQPNTTALSTLVDRDQDTVTAGLQGNVQGSPGWNTSSTNICNILTGSPIVGGLFDLGTADTPTGQMVDGGQTLFDILCGLLCGEIRAGTSPQTIIDGAQAASDQVSDNAFAQGLLDMGGGPDQDTGIPGGISLGLLSFLGALCNIGTGSTDVSQTTPQTVIDTARTTTSGAHLLLTGKANASATGWDVYDASSRALKQNNARHLGAQALTPATAVSIKAQNLLIAQDFSDAYTVVGNEHWSWDGTDGDGKLGCIKVVCDGTQDPYVSNEIPVVVGETIEVTARVEWSGLSFTGDSPLRLGVQKYRQARNSDGSTVFRDVGSRNVDVVESPGGSGDWTDLAGTYVVEPGVDQVRFRLDPAQNATAGTVRFDSCTILKLDLIDDLAVPGLGSNVDNIVTNLYGIDGEGFSRNDSAIALANTAATLTTLASRIAALEATAGGFTGAIAGDDFNWSGEITADANWGGSYSGPGTYVANGIDAVFNPGPNIFFNNTMQFDWQGEDEESSTDYQLIQVVLDSAPVTSHGYQSAIHLHGRIAPDWSSFIQAEFVSDGTWALKSYASGVFTTIDSGTCAVPGLGSILNLYCGDKNTTAPRHFKLQVGTAVLYDDLEVGTASQYGASNRKWGWGAFARGGLYFALLTFLPARGKPPKVNQWLGLDQ